ncbi:MAG: phosphatase PAP2 family protein [Candidatus Rokubacteria bacterium]|nr:phosphatase PAP2 family protein [Candidatus Rokubacteria bacterium]MBI3107130.1 phosphatase PAP2 family protein [Candidatus Rokubacteria bacterium]
MTSIDTARWRTVCLASLAAFAALALVALAAGVPPGDAMIRQGLLDGRSPHALEAARWVNHGGTYRVLIPAALLLFALSPVARRHWWLWGAVLAGSGAAETAAKLLVGRPRPTGGSFGFPSGHAIAAAAFAVILIYVVSRERWSRGRRVALGALGLILALGVGWARVMLDAHWPTDVLGGWALGTACAAAAAWWESARLAALGGEP